MARPKKIKLLILLGRHANLAAADLGSNITDGINEVIASQGVRFLPALFTDPEGLYWTQQCNAAYEAAELIADADSEADLEALSGDLETALGNAGL